MKQLLTILFLLICNFVFATNYYVDSTGGNDSNNGLTTGTAWRSISKINSFTFASGDIINFKAGQTYPGKLIVPRSNLSFNFYGTGAKPIISGFAIVSGWVNIGTNLWEAPVTNVKSYVNLVTKNDIIQQVGRFPNATASNGGYLALTAATGNSTTGGTCTITGPSLSGTTDWTGAELVIRIQRWDIQRARVSAHSGNVISYPQVSGNHYTAKVGYGYFFQRDSRTLDVNGEWWFDSVNNKLRIYSTTTPTGYKISTIDTLCYSSQSNTTINNIEFQGANQYGLLMVGATSPIVTSCDFNLMGSEGAFLSFCSTATVNLCTSNNCLGGGISVKHTQSGVTTNSQSITNCTADSTALIAGMEISGDANKGSGLTIQGIGVTFTGNTATKSGYGGIEWAGSDVVLKYNYVDGFCYVRDDGGGIYTYNTGGSSIPYRYNRVVRSNIVKNGIGNNNGTDNPNGVKANGLYFDEGSRNIIIDSNSVSVVRGAALIANSFDTLTVTANMLYNNTTGTYSHLFERFNNAPVMNGLTMKKNVIYPYKFYFKDLTINLPSLVTVDADILRLGIMDSNYNWKKSGTDSSLFFETTYSGNTNYASGYRTYSYIIGTITQEAHSTLINTSNNPVIYSDNPSNSPITMSFPGLRYVDAYGVTYDNSATVNAWKSKLLIFVSSIPVVNPSVSIVPASSIITLPTDFEMLTGSVTVSSGSITGVLWTQVSGPNTAVITPTTATTTLISGMTLGTYVFKLTANSSSGGTGNNTATIMVVNSAGAGLLISNKKFIN